MQCLWVYCLQNQDHLFQSFLTFDGAYSSFSFRSFSSFPLSSLLPFFFFCKRMQPVVTVLTGLESHGHFCPRPCSSTYRWARITIHAKGPHSMKSVLSRPLWPCSHRICVIAQRLGSLHKLAHAASNRSALKSGSKKKCDTFA